MSNLDGDRGGGGKSTVKGLFQHAPLHFSSTQTLRITSASVLFSESSGGAEPGGWGRGSVWPVMVYLQSGRITDFPWEREALGQSRHINYCSVKQRVILVNDYTEEEVGGPSWVLMEVAPLWACVFVCVISTAPFRCILFSGLCTSTELTESKLS